MIYMSIICNGRNYECYDKIDFIDIGGSKGGSYKFIKINLNLKMV